MVSSPEPRESTRVGPRVAVVTRKQVESLSHFSLAGNTDNLALSDTWALDVNSGKWTQFESEGHFEERYAHSANLLAQNLIIVFGGYNSHDFFNDLHILDLTTRKWSKVEHQGNNAVLGCGSWTL